MSVGPPSRSFAAASVQTTSLVNPTSLLRTPLLRLWGVHETLSSPAVRDSPTLSMDPLSVGPPSRSFAAASVQTTSLLLFSLSSSISHVVSVYASSCDLLLFFFSQRPTSISTPPCVSTAGLSTLSLFNGGSSVLSSVLSLFFIFLSVTRGACPFARP